MNKGRTSSSSGLDTAFTTNNAAVQRRWYRWHASSYFAVAAVGCALALIAIPGQIVDCVRDVMDSYSCHTYLHGWPDVFLKRYIEYGLDNDQFLIDPQMPPWLHARCWHFTSEGVVTSQKFFPGILAMDAAYCLLVLGCVGGAAEWRRRRRQRVWQFSLTEMLAGVVLCAAALGCWRWQRDQHASAVLLTQRLEKDGASFEFGYVGPAWLGRLIGTQMLEHSKAPVKASLYRNSVPLINELFSHRDAFRQLKQVNVSSDGDEITAQSMELVSQLAGLKTLSFMGCRLDDGAITRIAEMPSLREVSLSMCDGMTETALEKLRARKHFEHLWIFLTPPAASED